MADATDLFFTGVSLTGFFSTAVVWYMRPALTGILVDLCGTEARARFWTTFSTITVGLTPVLFAMHYRPAPATPGVFVVSTELEWGLTGLLLAVLLLGVILSKYIPRQATPNA